MIPDPVNLLCIFVVLVSLAYGVSAAMARVEDARQGKTLKETIGWDVAALFYFGAASLFLPTVVAYLSSIWKSV